jgi:chemotaxis signal transduction protein
MINSQEKAIKRITAHMADLNQHKNDIFQLQSVWDNLSLLAQLSGTGIDISQTREDFGQVTQSVMDNLSIEMLNKTICSLESKAFVIINLVVRNLFERTADIGFFATDDDIRHFLIKYHQSTSNQADFEYLKSRFSEYVKKYSVYHNVILLDPDGKLLVQLDQSNAVEYSTDPLIVEAITTNKAYVEIYRKTDLLLNHQESLIYAYRVTNPETQKVLGVLCLCFKFEDEMHRLFNNLLSKEEWAIGVMLDANKQVIASSDEYQIPLGATLETTTKGVNWILTRFAGREYIAVSRKTRGYQGYSGPNWMGHALIPMEYAFETDHHEALHEIDPELLRKVMRSPLIFSHNLLDIPKNAAIIQSKLNQSVWNGNIWQNNDNKNNQNKFSKTLLWEISNTGLKTQKIIRKTVDELYQTVVSIMLENSKFQAYLAADIMDRNLYERANDCRWWALTKAFREILSNNERSSKELSTLQDILQYINSLYTVYENLVLFDRQGKIISVSNLNYKDCVGTIIEKDWAARVRSLNTSQEYVVSKFEPSPLYNGKHTYIFASAIRSLDNQAIVGGIGIVFDSTPQFNSILNDVSPRNNKGELIEGSFTAFVDEELTIVASTRPDAIIGGKFFLLSSLSNLSKGSKGFDIAVYQNRYYAVGGYTSSGYREFKSKHDAYQNNITAMIFIPLGDEHEINALIAEDNRSQHNEFKTNVTNKNTADTIEFATFYAGEDWLGLPSTAVIEAIEPHGIRKLPQSKGVFEGVIKFNEEVIPVFNLTKALNISSDLVNKNQQIIVLNATKDNPKFGILVGALGEIPSINPNDIEAHSNIFSSNSSSIATGITSMQSSEHKKIMLTIVSAESIWAKFNPKLEIAA